MTAAAEPDGGSADQLDLSEEEPSASQRGLSPPPSVAAGPPPHRYVREVALWLLGIFGGCLLAIIVLASAIAWLRPDALQDVIGFFGTVIAALGTLLGGVVAYYFARE